MSDRSRQGRGDLGQVILDAARRVAIERGPDFTAQDVIKVAGVSLQTFYRYFESRDRLVFAVISDWIQQHARALEQASSRIDDPIDRLEFFVRQTLQPVPGPEFARAAQFVTTEHWRLHQYFPDEMADAVEPFVELLRREIERAVEIGVLRSRVPARDARVMTRTVLGTFHHLSFFPDGPEAAAAPDDVWSFCLVALGGDLEPRGSRRDAIDR